MKLLDRVKEQTALQKEKYIKEALEQENKSQQKTALRLLAGFFAFMLLFTLLSRMADGLTIARVKTNTLSQGNVIHEIKAKGTVSSDSRESLRIVGDLLVDTVFAKSGQGLKKGDDIMSFDKSSAETLLSKLKNELAELNLKKANALSPDQTSVVIAKRNLENAELDYKRARSKADDAIRLAQEAYQKTISDYDKLYAEYDYKGYTDKRWISWIVEPVLTEEDITMLYPSQADDEKTVAWKAKMQEARTALKVARQNCINTERLLDTALKSDETDHISYQRGVDRAKLSYDEALKKGNEALSQASVDNQIYTLNIKQKESDIAILQELKKAGWRLKSPMDGVLLNVKGEAGQTLPNGEVAALSKNSEGYKLDVIVTKEQVEFLKEGDEVNVNLMADGKKTDVKAFIKSIALAKEKDTYELTVVLPDGVYLIGENATMTYSQVSEQFYCCLPLNALRSDADGNNFVLVAVEKDTVLGKEAVAKRVDIKILDRDTKTMEIFSSLLKDDKVIVSANKAIEKNDRVRVEP